MLTRTLLLAGLSISVALTATPLVAKEYNKRQHLVNATRSPTGLQRASHTASVDLAESETAFGSEEFILSNGPLLSIATVLLGLVWGNVDRHTGTDGWRV